MWGVRRWLVLPSHFPLVLLEPRGRKEGGMKERQRVEVQELSGEVQMRPVSREACHDIESVESKIKKHFVPSNLGPRKFGSGGRFRSLLWKMRCAVDFRYWSTPNRGCSGN